MQILWSSEYNPAFLWSIPRFRHVSCGCLARRPGRMELLVRLHGERSGRGYRPGGISWTECIIVAPISVFFAMLAFADGVLLLRLDRIIGDVYMAAKSSTRRDIIRSKHNDLCKVVIFASIFALIFAGLYAFAARYGMTLQSFRDVDKVFVPLLGTRFFVIINVLFISGMALLMYPQDLR